MKDQESTQYMRIFLDSGERLFLLGRVRVSDELRIQLERPDGRPLETWIAVDEAESIREGLQGILQVEGFDENYRPTKIGRISEALLDKMFTG